MLGYQDCCAQTAFFRPAGFHTEEFIDRFILRVVMKKYRESIWSFRSRLQLVCAIRDALVGHRALYEREIIHRDASVFNILMGKAGAPEGDRGILIDLDMATYVEGGHSCFPSDPSVGTCTFQSMNVVQGWSLTPQPQQNYLDELESFFYVYCYILHAFKKPGTLVKQLVDPVSFWNTDDLRMNAIGKGAFGCNLSRIDLLPEYWEGPCMDLMQDFHDVVRDVMQDKKTINSNRALDEEGKLEAYDALAQTSGRCFDSVKAAFDKAVLRLQDEEPGQGEPRGSSSLLDPHAALVATPISTASERVSGRQEHSRKSASLDGNSGKTFKKRPVPHDDDTGAAHKRARKGGSPGVSALVEPSVDIGIGDRMASGRQEAAQL